MCEADLPFVLDSWIKSHCARNTWIADRRLCADLSAKYVSSIVGRPGTVIEMVVAKNSPEEVIAYRVLLRGREVWRYVKFVFRPFLEEITRFFEGEKDAN